MQFREALAKICKEPVAKNGAFLTYAKLSDLCGNDYESVRKISLFYQIDRKLLVAHHIQTEGKLAVPVLLAAYPAVENLISQSGYQAMISAAAEAILGEQPQKGGATKPAGKPRAAVVKKKRPLPKPRVPDNKPVPPPQDRQPLPASRKQQAAAPNVLHANLPAAKQKKTNAGANHHGFSPNAAIKYNGFSPNAGAKHHGYSTSVSGSGAKWFIFGILICLYLAGLFFLYRYVASTELPTWAKWLIGIGTVVVTTIVHLWPTDFDFWEPELPQPIFCGITLLVNTLCAILFGHQTVFLAACITIDLLVFVIFFTIFAYLDEEEILEILCPIEIFVGLIVLAAIFSFPIFMQWVIGVAFAGLFSLAIWKVAYDEMISEYGVPAFSALICLLVNAVLLLIFKGQYRIISHWVSGTCALYAIGHAFYCFDDSEPGFGGLSVFNALLGIGEFILPFLISLA